MHWATSSPPAIDRARLKKAAITDDDLRDIRIRYHDDWTEASRLDAGAVDGLIAELQGAGPTGLPGMYE